MDSILRTLNIDFQALIVNFIGFALLWLIARKLVFLPIGKVIAERQQEIDTTYSKIDADQQVMAATRTDYERRLSTIEEERRETVQRAINEAMATRDQIIHEANARAQETIARAEQEARREQEQAMITLRGNIVDLALGAATKVIGDNMDETRQRRLIDEFIQSGGTAANVPPAAPAVSPAAAAATPVATPAAVPPTAAATEG